MKIRRIVFGGLVLIAGAAHAGTETLTVDFGLCCTIPTFSWQHGNNLKASEASWRKNCYELSGKFSDLHKPARLLGWDSGIAKGYTTSRFSQGKPSSSWLSCSPARGTITTYVWDPKKVEEYDGDLPTLDFPLNKTVDTEVASQKYMDACLAKADALKKEHGSDFFAASCGTPEVVGTQESGNEKNGTWSYRVTSRMRLWLVH